MPAWRHGLRHRQLADGQSGGRFRGRAAIAEGDIRWTAPDPQTPEDDALVTGNSSIHKSLICAEKLANALGHERKLAQGAAGLADTLANKPQRFDHMGTEDALFDGLVLSGFVGALSPEQARRASPRAGMIS